MPNVEYGSENTQASSGHLFNADGAVNEPALIAACRRGNCDALTMLVERYTPDIYAGVASAWQDAAHKACDLDDLVQEVFLIILESPSRRLTCTHDELRDLHGWLRAIAHNTALNKLVSPAVSWPLDDTAPESQPLDEIPDQASGYMNTDHVLRQAKLANLSDPSIAVLELYLGDGPSAKPCTVCEIAHILGMSPSLVYYKLARIRQRILEGKFAL
jgi:RNA polymerase sigma factor (sigma-70 family)